MTTIACGGTREWNTGPLWLRLRTLGQNKTQKMQMSHDIIKELKIEARLTCRNYGPEVLEWNQRGNLLASSNYNDRSGCGIIIWDALKQQAKCRPKTGHKYFYFPFINRINLVKFMPASDDTRIVTYGSDGEVRLTNLLTNQSSLVCTTEGSFCRIPRLAVHPDEPNLILLSRLGHLIQHDIRQANGSDDQCFFPENGPGPFGPLLNCVAINPLRSEILAVGSDDCRIRLFDRRALRPFAPLRSCFAQFVPSHLDGESRFIGLSSIQSLAFNQNGSELIASYLDGRVYLFNTHEPREKFHLSDTTKFHRENPQIFDQVKNDPVKMNSLINGNVYEYSRRYCGQGDMSCHSEANFFGGKDEFIVSCCHVSCGHGPVCIWDKDTTNIVNIIQADSCRVLPNPSICMLASIHCDQQTGTGDAIELWSTIGGTNIASVVRDELPSF